MEKLQPVLKYLKNKYLLVLAIAVVWMLFFDRYNLPSQIRLWSQNNVLEADRDFYLAEKERIEARKQALFTDAEELERFAREKYHMKRSDEDVYIVPEKENR